jgi:methionine-rich copper-binding protein CopC
MSPQPSTVGRRSGAAALVLILLVVLAPPPTIAHSDLQSSDPASGAEVPSPFSGPITLTFTEALAVGSKADLYGAGHQLVASATIEAGTMTIAPTTTLAPGQYSVEWVSIADDGDLLRGTVAFIVAAAPSASAIATSPPSSSSSAAPTNAPGAAATGASPSPTASPAPSDQTGGTGGDVVLPIVIALILAAAGAFYLVRRNRPA